MQAAIADAIHQAAARLDLAGFVWSDLYDEDEAVAALKLLSISTVNKDELERERLKFIRAHREFFYVDAKVLLALALVSCGETVCDEAARKYCQRVLFCNIIPDAGFDDCLLAKKKRLRDLGLTDKQCADAQFEVGRQSRCELAAAVGATIPACTKPVN